jgi:hypothetical protein
MPVYTNPSIDQEVSPKFIYYVDNKCAIFTCNGLPEGIILANTGSIAISDNGSIYKKTTDDLTTGWVELTGGTITSPLVISGANPILNFDDTDPSNQTGSITVEGGTPIVFRPNGQIVGVGLGITPNITPVGNTNATLQSLQSLVVPANSLAADGDYLKIVQAGDVATVGPHNRRWVSNFGGQVIRDTGNISLTSNALWNIITTIIRTSSTSVVATINGDWGQSTVGAGNFFSLGWSALLTVSDLNANPQTLLLQAQDANGTANNIRQLFTTCEIYQF